MPDFIGGAGFITYGRDGPIYAPSPYELPVILPVLGSKDPCAIGWADAKFAITIMAEHALFFVLLMPPEVAEAERKEAQRFYKVFTEIGQKIDAMGIPVASDLKVFADSLVEHIKPFIEYKHRMQEAQTTGKLWSLVWPLFFDHTRREAERWSARLMQISRIEPEYDRREVTTFWTEIFDDHCEFISHLLDPTEKSLIAASNGFAKTFHDLQANLVADTAACSDSFLTNSEALLEFKTEAVRGIEMGRIKSIIDPRLADHVRREAIKGIDEMRRAV